MKTYSVASNGYISKMARRFKMRQVTKYQLREILHSVLFFILIYLMHLSLFDLRYFPVWRMLFGVILFSLAISGYEMYLGPKIKKYVKSALYYFITLVFYNTLFLFMLLLLISIEPYFKHTIIWQPGFTLNSELFNPVHIHFVFFYFFVILAIRFLLIYHRTRSYPGLAKNFLTRSQNGSLADEKVFMFMDLIDSTRYAEKLGYLEYSAFIRDIFNELDEFVLETKGAIYQFVGDEVVIVWSLENGVENDNCLRFLALFYKRLENLRMPLLDTYGIFPEFKAGFHAGEVAFTEIGGLTRKEIAFHGDTVNTTARICSKCRELNERILLSGDMKATFLNPKHLQFTACGSYMLKGKKRATELYAVPINELKKLT